mgnify:CR=1 FL=1
MPNRQDKRGRTKYPDGRYIVLLFSMMQSEQYRALSGPALKVLHELTTRFNGLNNGDLSLGLEQAATLLRIGKATASKAFKELEDSGFVRRNVTGSWIKGHATTYWITFVQNKGEARTNDWQSRAAPARRPRRRVRKPSFKALALQLIRDAGAAKEFLGSDTDRNAANRVLDPTGEKAR